MVEEKEYIFPFAYKDEYGTYHRGTVTENQIISTLGELPSESNFDALIQKSQVLGLKSWKKTLEYWQSNRTFE